MDALNKYLITPAKKYASKYMKKYAAKHAVRLFAFLLVLAVGILPAAAGILSTLPELIPDVSGAAYEAIYEQTQKVKVVTLPDGSTRELTYTEYAYTVTLHADYINQQMDRSTLTREAIKRIHKDESVNSLFGDAGGR